MEILDMPKLESPFVRQDLPAGTNGRMAYLVTPQITEGFEWVFEDNSVLATEKLDGTNVSVTLQDGRIAAVYNRENPVDPWTGDEHIVQAIRNSRKRTRFTDGQYFGEVIGPGVQSNPYKLDKCEWVPFDSYAKKKLAYRTWGRYPKTFEAITEWFADGPISLFYMNRHGGEQVPAEGVVFHHPDGRMAKLRRDMFTGYVGKGHR